jgi:predicted aminopeptidase
MIILNKGLLLAACFLSISCSKLSYVTDQGIGQIGLLYNAKDNQKLLNDPEVDEESKRKIRLVEDYKKVFYEYYGEKSTKIYSKTTFLKQDAVTYLVVTTPYNSLTPNQECFVFMGCFPYLGFFSKDKAQKYFDNKVKLGDSAYLRPVYAYSTLGYFTDTILSSFFYYNDLELAELIFHELFHTILFVKNNVNLNEALANYFSEQMVLELYLKDGENQKAKEQEAKTNALRAAIVEQTKKLELLYRENFQSSREEIAGIFKTFLDKDFYPNIKKKCEELSLDERQCFPLKGEWSNARFAGFLTYEENSDEIHQLRVKLGLNLKDFYLYIKKQEKNYKKGEESFTDFLFSPVRR